MDIRDLIEQKKKGLHLTREEIGLIIYGYSKGEINDSRMIEFMKAINTSNFSFEETYYLADAIAKTGTFLKIGERVGEIVVDKHSAGSYSDSTTLIFISVLAALGVKTVKVLSDKFGLYGTSLDRLSIFKHFNAKVSPTKLVNIINEVGAGVLEEKGEFSKVDSRMYELRLKYGIKSEPLIAASIVAKKIATGSDIVIYDVKSGEGAIFPSDEFAITLATYLVNASNLAGMKTASVVTDLNQPLGAGIGARTEVEETISVLRSERTLYDANLLAVSKELVIMALLLTGKANGRADASSMFDQVIKSGKALDKFREILAAYGGVYEDFKHTPDRLLDGVAISYLTAKGSGYIADVNISKIINSYAILLNSNGKKKDLTAGYQLMVREGSKVNEGDKLVRIFYSINNTSFQKAYIELSRSIYITKNKQQAKKVFHKLIM